MEGVCQDVIIQESKLNLFAKEMFKYERKNLVPIGLSCLNESICAGGSLCRNGICSCALGEVVMNGKCSSEFSIGGSGHLLPGSPCNDTAECGGGAQCRDKMCVCLPGAVIQNGVCVSTVGGRKLNSNFENLLFLIIIFA